MRLNSKGETIVEVLIVVAVLGAVLTGAFSIASRTLLTARQSQERSEAIGIAQNQIERLKNAVSTTSITATRFCFSSTAPSLIPVSVPSTIGNPLNSTNLGNYPAQCVVANRYHTVTQYDASTRIYTVYVHWENAPGTGQDRLSMVYRVSQISQSDDSLWLFAATKWWVWS